MPQQRLNPVLIELIGVRLGLIFARVVTPESTSRPGRKLDECRDFGHGLGNCGFSNQSSLQIRAELTLTLYSDSPVGRLRMNLKYSFEEFGR